MHIEHIGLFQKVYDRSGIRTHTTTVTGALNQRLRLLGHPVFLEKIRIQK